MTLYLIIICGWDSDEGMFYPTRSWIMEKCPEMGQVIYMQREGFKLFGHCFCNTIVRCKVDTTGRVSDVYCTDEQSFIDVVFQLTEYVSEQVRGYIRWRQN